MTSNREGVIGEPRPDGLDRDPQAAFCATLVDEWVRAGVAHAVVSPGSRSTPMALALHRDTRIAVHVVLDERSAGFTALGIGLSSGIPSIVLTTSGTAAVELHPSVVEASEARVPMLVVTADRPVGSYELGAPQTINQQRLFGDDCVRWFIDPGLPKDLDAPMWRWVAARAAVAAMSSPPGPVHLNLPFDEPLVAPPQEPEVGMDNGARLLAHDLGPRTGLQDEMEELSALADLLTSGDGLVLAGGGISDPRSVLALAELLGWPVLADHRSGCRLPHPCVVAHWDALARSKEFRDLAEPALVLRMGMPLPSRALSEWLGSLQVPQIGVDAFGRVWDPEGSTVATIGVEPGELSSLVRPLLADRGTGPNNPWLAKWRSVDDSIESLIDSVCSTGKRDGGPVGESAGASVLNETILARRLVGALPDGATLVVSSSMPIRDLDWYASPREGVTVFANRGANGIDGVVSTSLGVAIGSDSPVAVLLGDLALLHDSSSLVGLTGRDVQLTMVVIDNDGGGIFSFLPQAGELPSDEFEYLFGTPHGSDLAALVSAHGIPVTEAGDGAAFSARIASSLAGDGVSLILFKSDRGRNREEHSALDTAIARLVGTAARGFSRP